MTTREFEFGKIDYNHKGKKVNPVTVEINLKNNRDGYPVYTTTVKVWKGNRSDVWASGRLFDEIKRVPYDDALYQELRRLAKYHLNDFHAGTKAQTLALEKAGLTGAVNYDKAVEYLKHKGLYEVRLTPTEAKYNPTYAGKPYKYGHGWIYYPIPSKDMAKIKKIMMISRS